MSSSPVQTPVIAEVAALEAAEVPEETDVTEEPEEELPLVDSDLTQPFEPEAVAERERVCQKLCDDIVVEQSKKRKGSRVFYEGADEDSIANRALSAIKKPKVTDDDDSDDDESDDDESDDDDSDDDESDDDETLLVASTSSSVAVSNVIRRAAQVVLFIGHGV